MSLHLLSCIAPRSEPSNQPHDDGPVAASLRRLPARYELNQVRKPSTYRLRTQPRSARTCLSDGEDEIELIPSSSSSASDSDGPLAPRAAEYSQSLLPHLARVWQIPEGRIQALLVDSSCLSPDAGDAHWIHVSKDCDWSAFCSSLLSVSPSKKKADPVVRVDIVLREIFEVPASHARQPSHVPRSTVSDSDEHVLPATCLEPSRSTTTSAKMQEGSRAAEDDPQEEVPTLFATPASSTPRADQPYTASQDAPIISAVAAASAGLDLASGIIASLSGLARSVSQQAEQMRNAHATTRSQPLASLSPPASMVPGAETLRDTSAEDPGDADLLGPGSGAGVDQSDATDSAGRHLAPSLLAGLTAELAAMRANPGCSTTALADPIDEDVPPQASRSRSRSRSRRRRSSPLSSTLSILTLFLFVFTLLSPPIAAAANTRRSPPQHLCKCTCFSTNSTLVPIFAPEDPAKPCLTCTRQFCIDQGLEICKGARVAPTDGDTGTGWEGDVWAKCFERDDYKDQSIILLYLFTIVGLLAVTAFRGRVRDWYEEYQSGGPRGLYNAVANAPWRTRQ